LSRFSPARSFHRVNSLQDRATAWSIAPSSLSRGPMHLHSAEGGRNTLDRYAVSNSHGTSLFLLNVDRSGSNEVVLHEVDGPKRQRCLLEVLLKRKLISSFRHSFRSLLDAFTASNISPCHFSSTKVPAQIGLVLSQTEASVASCKSTN
jgi:hypothetical protein